MRASEPERVTISDVFSATVPEREFKFPDSAPTTTVRFERFRFVVSRYHERDCIADSLLAILHDAERIFPVALAR